MARPVIVTKNLTASNAALLAASQTPVSGTALALTGSAPDTQRRILLTYGNEAVPRTLVVSGTNDAGGVISETLTVPSGGGGTIATVQDFTTVASAVPAGGGWSAAVTLGTNGVGSTPWFVPNQHVTPFEVAFQCDLLSGAANFSIETTQNSPLAPLSIYVAGYSQTLPVPNAYGLSGMTALAASAQGSATGSPIAAWRLTINSGAGTVKATAVQAGIAGP